jgi:predicted Zn finger-like uncharacterized protein
MKITCQSCQSKYNVADDKVTGKIVKIRCRKCGATIVVDGTTAAAGGNSTTSGSSAVAAPQPSAAEAPSWHVNVSDNDQRTMTLSELVDAYNASTITQETFIWIEGMEDWKPLKDVEAVVAALHGHDDAAPASAVPASIAAHSMRGADVAAVSMREPAVAREPAAAREDESTRAFQKPAAAEPRPVAYASPLDSQPEAPRAEPKRAALKRETRGRDLFGGGAGGELQTSRAANDPQAGVMTSAPLMPQGGLSLGDEATNKLTGERNENSVLFSLAMLTKNADERAPAKAANKTATNEDSGLIDLKALAAKAESVRPPTLGDGGHFSAPLGTAGVISAPFGAVGASLEEAPQKSRLPVLIGIGAVVIALVVLAAFIGVRIGTSNSAATAVPATPATASAGPSTSASAEAAAASAAASASAEAAAAAAASAAPSAAAKPKPAPAGGTYHPPAQSAAKPTTAATAAPATTSPGAAPKKSDCGCNGDLMCLMKCSTAH